jgi:hypothetical protein
MLDKHYDHVAVENGKYEKWVSEGYFTAGQDKSKPAFFARDSAAKRDGQTSLRPRDGHGAR